MRRSVIRKSVRRKYDWEKVDPFIFSKKVTLIELATEYKIPYRQVTNRKYNLRDKVQILIDKGDTKALNKLLKYLKVKDVNKIRLLGS